FCFYSCCFDLRTQRPIRVGLYSIKQGGGEMEKQVRLRIYGRSQLMSHTDSLLLSEKHPTYLDEMSVCVSLRPRQAMDTLALTTSSLDSVSSNPDETESSCAADCFWIRGDFKSSFCSATVFSDDGRRTFLPDLLPSSLKASQHQEPNDPFQPRSQSFALIPSKTFQIPPADELIFGSD
ncbi:hypothetical protein XENOCAPTIV_001879, partial [Xenoophorus captivus]